MKVVELREFERVAAHSHITGLGLDGLKAKKIGDGFVGQEEAREAAGLIVRLIKQGKFAGRAVLIAGPPGTGKSALALGIAKELGKDVPFVHIAGSEIFSAEIKKTEFLMQALRKAIGVRIHEMRKIYEGKVVDLHIDKEQNPYNPYQYLPAGASITLKTRKDKKRLNVDQSFAMQIIQQNIQEGDVVQIDPESGRIIKVGRSEDEGKKEDYIAAEAYVPVPEGNVMKEKEFVYTMTLHQLDLSAVKQSTSIFDMFFGGRHEGEIDNEARKHVDEAVKNMVEEGKAEIIPGVIFIDECSLLDIETFAFLNRAMEQELAPIIIFATNRGMAKIRGTDYKAAHAMPIDLLDRLLIINTRKYNAEEIKEILKVRSKVEKIELSKEALDLLVEIGSKTSLRYAVQLIAPASMVMQEEGKKQIEKRHIEKARKLFADVKRSVRYLKQQEKEFLEY